MTKRRPLGNVLVATDFSTPATRAVERAARLPIGPGSALTVLHVLPPGSRPQDRVDAERALAHAASVAGDSAAKVGRNDADVFPCLVEGTPFVEIVRSGRHGRNELIVVGRHGERTFRERLFGSTADSVIRKGDMSILVVASPPAAPYERPLVAVDCSDTSRHAVELAWRLAAPGLQALDVIHAYEPIPESAVCDAGLFGEAARQFPFEAKLQAQAAVATFLASCDAPAPANIILREGDVQQVILEVAAQRDTDILALGTHGRSGLAHVLLASVAEVVIREASCDVLVARTIELPFKVP